jgi:ketosteroid isomerase-like protein
VSTENVQLVRRLLEVYNERSFDENLDLMDPEFVWDVSRVPLPDADTHRGREEFERFHDTWLEGFEVDHVEAEEIVDAGDHVVVMIHHRGRGKTTKIEVEQRYAMVWTLRDGRAVSAVMYETLEDALEAVGAREQAVSSEADGQLDSGGPFEGSGGRR